MIKWKFNDLEVYFESKTENLQRDISKMAYANNIKQTSEITIIDGPVTQFISPDTFSIYGDTASISQPTVSVGAKKVKTTKSETNELPTVPSNVDNVVAEPDTLESTDSDSNTSESGDGIPS
jgi:hypothetical protein